MMLSTADAAQYLGLSVWTLRQWRKNGSGPQYLRYGKTNRSRAFYRKEDVDKWLEEKQRFNNTTEESVACQISS